MGESSAPKPVLLCFHGTGSSQACFKQIATDLMYKSAIVYGICLPGRMNHNSEKGSFNTATIKEYVRSIFIALIKMGKIWSTKVQRKVILIGHCFGAVIAFEVARLLHANGISISALIVCSSPSPVALSQSNKNRRPPDPRRRARQLESFDPLSESDVEKPPEMCSLFTDDELMRKVMTMQAIACPALLERKHDLLKLFLPTFRKDFQLMEAYHYGSSDDEIDASFFEKQEGKSILDDEDDTPVEDRPIRMPILLKVSAPIIMYYLLFSTTEAVCLTYGPFRSTYPGF